VQRRQQRDRVLPLGQRIPHVRRSAPVRRWPLLPIALALCAGAVGCGEQRENTVDLGDVPSPPVRRDSSPPEALEERSARAERPRTGLLPEFEAFATKLGGELGATVGASGSADPAVGGSLRTGSAWSTIKVPIAMRVVEDAGGPGQLTVAQRSQIQRALTASDNAAAGELFGGLAARHGGVPGAARAVTDVLREAGDGATEVSTKGRDGFSPYGQTEWSLRAQHRFMAALAGGCVGSRASSRYLLGLMGKVTSDRWGFGSAGAPARWKGGWGPGTDGRYLVRQMGVLTVGGRPVVVTIAARPADGTFASGQAMATRTAQWLTRRVDRTAGPSVGC